MCLMRSVSIMSSLVPELEIRVFAESTRWSFRNCRGRTFRYSTKKKNETALALNRPGCLCEPGAVDIIGHRRRHRRAHLRMIGVEPVALLARQHRRLDEIEIDWRHGDGLEAQHPL